MKAARERCDDARKALSVGLDPSAHRKAAKLARAEQSANRFEVITQEWYAKHADNWAASHSQRVIRLFKRDVFPWLGSRPAVDITAPELLAVMRRIIEHQLAHAVRDPHGRAYNRTAHLAERRKMMQKWADYLDKLKAGADVLPLPRSA